MGREQPGRSGRRSRQLLSGPKGSTAPGAPPRAGRRDAAATVVAPCSTLLRGGPGPLDHLGVSLRSRSPLSHRTVTSIWGLARVANRPGKESLTGPCVSGGQEGTMVAVGRSPRPDPAGWGHPSWDTGSHPESSTSRAGGRVFAPGSEAVASPASAWPPQLAPCPQPRCARAGSGESTCRGPLGLWFLLPLKSERPVGPAQARRGTEQSRGVGGRTWRSSASSQHPL